MVPVTTRGQPAKTIAEGAARRGSLSFRRPPTSSATLLQLTSVSLRAKAAATVRYAADPWGMCLAVTCLPQRHHPVLALASVGLIVPVAHGDLPCGCLTDSGPRALRCPPRRCRLQRTCPRVERR